MNGTHPSDEVLQQYVVEPEACTAEEIGHIGSCPDCRAAAAAYHALTDELTNQPLPAFGFDLAGSVIARLGEQPKIQRNEGSILTSLLIAAFIGVPLWWFRRSAYYVFTDMPAVFYGVLLVTTAIVVGMYLLRLHKKYQDVINLLNK